MPDDRFIPSHILSLVKARDRPINLNHMGYASNWFLTQLNRSILNIEVSIMPSKSSRNAAKNSWVDITFVDIRLSKADTTAFREFMQKSPDDLSLALADFIADGNKTSMSWDSEHNTFIAAATCKNPDSVNKDCCITSRSSEWFEALMLNVFKHLVICKAGEWVGEQTDRSWG